MLRLEESEGGEVIPWERNMDIEIESLPIYRYVEGSVLRLQRGSRWLRFVVGGAA